MGGFSAFWAGYPHPPISRKLTREGGAVSIFTYVEIRSPLPLRSGPGLGRAGAARRGSPPGPGAEPPARGSPPGPGRGVPPGVRGQGRAGAAAGAGVYPPGFCRPERSGFAAGAGRGLPPGFAARGRAGVYPPGVRRPGPAGPLPGPGCTRRGFAARGGRGLPPGRAGVCPPGFAARGRPGRYARLSRRPVFARLLVTKKSQKDKEKISKT